MSKNTHLEHLEDSILLDGKQGAKDAFVFLDLLANTFSGKGSNSFKITTKWDGAPAIFCGIHPVVGKFFVGTKSIFNKSPKINFTAQDIDRNHGDSPGLVEKLKVALEYFPELGIKGIAQGDLLFTDDTSTKTIDGKKQLTFQPNTITYAIPEGDDFYVKAKAAKIGVVFHTTYRGSTIETLNASFGYDVSKLKETKNVLVLSSETGELGKDTLLTNAEKSSLTRLKQKTNVLLQRSGNFLDVVSQQIADKDQLTIGPRLKIFFNKYVRDGKRLPLPEKFVKEFKNYFQEEVHKAADKVKTPKAKASKLSKLYDGLDLIDSNEDGLKRTVELYTVLQGAKEVFIRKLEKGEKFGTYLKTENGYEITAPEGYVAINEGNNAIKLVDRLEFSKANFNVSKNWVSGDEK